MRVFLDTNVPLYAVGAASPHREACIDVLRRVASDRVEAVTDVEVFQEILHRARARERLQDRFAAFDLFWRVMRGHVEAILAGDAAEARRLFERYPSAGARDLIHVAVCRRCGVEEIVSVDRDFDEIEEIRRVDPKDLLRRSI